VTEHIDFGGPATGPLAGVKVADFTAVYSGPLAATILADQGADVIKIEPPRGDLMRGALPKQGGMASSYLTLNRNKRSLCVDLGTEAGLKVAQDLVASADVVMENFRPGVMERLGLGYEQFAKRMPKLVFTSINGVGPDGPYAKRRVYDAVIQALSGFASLPVDGVPALVNNLICDKITALTAAEAVVAALFQAERTGRGQKVEVSMLDANLSFLWSDALSNFTFLDEDTEKMPYADLSLFIRTTKDGFVAVMPVQQAEVEVALKVLGLESLIGDDRFKDFESRARNRDAMKQLTDQAYANYTTAEICELLEANDVPFSTVNQRHEVVDDPQIKHMGALWEFDHPRVGATRQSRPAAQFSATPANFHRPTAFLGEHNHEILAELGYKPEIITAFENDKVLHAEVPDDSPN
jgi:crotonobetainyl-CoA:carnitine CoA-transferase CaiB-like acyl-CoA transferase